MNITYLVTLWLNFCIFMRNTWRAVLLTLCLLCPETLLYLMRVSHDDNNSYYASVKEDNELDDHVSLFFYLFPHNCTELSNYIKFIYRYHPFYKWRSHEFTITVTRGDSIMTINPFTKVNVETDKKLMFGLIEFEQDK